MNRPRRPVILALCIAAAVLGCLAAAIWRGSSWSFDSAAWSLFAPADGISVGDFGRVVNGEFQEADEIPIYTCTHESDLVDLDPSCYLWGQFSWPINRRSDPPQPVVYAQVRAVPIDGDPLSGGLRVPFALVKRGEFTATYRSQKALLFITDAAFEGERDEFFTIACADGSEIEIVIPSTGP